MGEERSEPHVPSMIVAAEGDSSTVPRFASAGLNLAAVVAAFEEHGAVIVERGEEYTAGMHAQLQEHWAEAEEDEEDGGDGFYPGNTKRTVGLVTRAPAVHPLILDEVGLGICDGHLLPNCDEYQLNLTAGLSVGPGARQQELHREDDLWPFFPVPRPACAVASLTALSDFTVQTGATVSLRPSLALAGFPQLIARRGLQHLVLGSHRWEAGRRAQPHEVVQAVMPAGSTVYWAGGVLHAAGANTHSDEWRQSVFVSYALGWLR
eukprot:COSAG04_NODE_5416_length_1627_cov_1.357984_1_plen_263_part_10